MVQELLVGAQLFHNEINDLVYEWQFATMGFLGQKALNDHLWSFIWQTLDPPTRAYANVRHLVKYGAEVAIESCHTHVWLHINVPLLSQEKHFAFKTNAFPVLQDTHYVILKSYPYMIMWDDEKTYEYTEEEFNLCKQLKRLVICKPPQIIESLQNSCMFSLVKRLSPKCEIVPAKEVNNKLIFQDNFLTYYLGHNQSQLITEVCPGGHSRTTEIKDQGTIALPHRCKLLINGLTYENKISDTSHTVNTKPQFFTPDFHFKIPQQWNYTTPAPDTDHAETVFENDMKNLEISSDILGNLEIAPDHIIIASISFTSMLLITVIAIIVLYCIVCGPMAGCTECPRSRHSRLRIHRNSLTEV